MVTRSTSRAAANRVKQLEKRKAQDDQENEEDIEVVEFICV